MKIQLIENWRKAWTWFSVHAMLLAAAIQGAWLQIPEDMKSSIPPQYVQYATLALLAFGVAGRLIKQSSSEGANDDKQPKP